MKIANVSWGWTPIPEDTPHGDSLIKIADQIRELGFEAVDYLGTPEALDVFSMKEQHRAGRAFQKDRLGAQCFCIPGCRLE